MKLRTRIRWVTVGLAVLTLLAGWSQTFSSSEAARKFAQGGGAAISSSNTGGVIQVKIDGTRFGNLRVYLPDDIRAGDQVSGTLVADPAVGAVPEVVVVPAGSVPITVKDGQFTFKAPTIDQLPTLPRAPELTLQLSPKIGAPPESVSFPLPHLDNRFPESRNQGFTIPPLSQQGRATVIHGPFDGRLSDTVVGLGPRTGGNPGAPIRVLAESPRKVVFVAPADVTGPYSINVKEGDQTFTGNSRNVGVRLSAPKTSLLRGEKTTVSIEVSGLEGILSDTPMQLESKGVITMEGGNFQNLQIKSQEVGVDGRYRTSRQITGVQAGGFSVTATVIVRDFDFSLQDDSVPSRVFFWNTFTGNYIFINPDSADQSSRSGLKLQPGGGASGGGAAQGGKLQPGGSGGGAAQTGGAAAEPTPGSLNLTGTGKPQMKGCIITLSHNAPDRRVFARLDACTKTGDASVQTDSPKAEIKITDKNTADNTAATPPPK